MHRQQLRLDPPNPRRQLILDLQAWIEHIQAEQHQIILSMVANETFDPDLYHLGHSLQYDSSKLTSDSSHDGKLAALVASCGLCLPLARQHTTRPFPASHIRGDYIMISQSLLPAVQHSGVSSHHSLVRGDHLPYYLDFDSSILFSDPAYNIEPASFRKLRLQDPRVIQQYNSSHTNC